MTDFCSITNGKDLTYVYAFGDSHFSSMSPQLVSSLGTNYNYSEANFGGCPFAIGFSKETKEGMTLNECDTKYQQLRKSIIKPNSIIILGGRFPLYLSEYYFDNEEGGVEQNGTFYATYRNMNGDSLFVGIQKTISSLLDDGHEVVLIYPIPEVGVDVPKFIFKWQKVKSLSDFKSLTTSYEVYKERSASTFELFDSIQSPNIHRVYPHSLFCDKQIKGRCVTHNKEDVFYADDDHPSAKGSEMIVELIMEQIENAEASIRGN